MVVIDNKRERLCLASAEGLARETSLCCGATEHRYRTELHIYALKDLAHPRRNTHRDKICVNSTRAVLVYYLWSKARGASRFYVC